MVVVRYSSVFCARVGNHDPITTFLFFFIILIFIPVFLFSRFLGFIVVSWLFLFCKIWSHFIKWLPLWYIFLCLLLLECEHFVGCHIWVYSRLRITSLIIVIKLPRIKLLWVVMLSVWIAWWIQLSQIISLTWLEVNWKLLLTQILIILSLEFTLKDIG